MATKFTRGCIISFNADDPLGLLSLPGLLIFRFNPESISRSITIEKGKCPEGVEGAKEDLAHPPFESAAQQTAGTTKESFSVDVIFDLFERAPFAQNILPALGILPELAAVERLAYPVATNAFAALAGAVGALFGGAGVKKTIVADPRFTTLFIFGPTRILPVEINSIKINETMHNTLLAPVRATVTIDMEVAQKHSIHDKISPLAYEFNKAKREVLALLYLATTVDLVPDIIGPIL